MRPTTFRHLAVAVGAALLLAAGCTSDSESSGGPGGTTVDGTGSKPLPADAQATIDDPDFATARWALRVVPVDGGDAVFELDAGAISAMGSNTKLYSVGTWLDVLGPDHTIETPVYGLGTVDGGTLDGDLVLRAMGDLVMGGRNAGSGELGYSVPPQPDANGLPGAKPAPGNPLAGLEDLADQVVAAGITEVGGNVVIDDRLWELWTTPRPSEISPIVINDNLLAVQTSPGTVGEAGSVTAIPETEAFTVVNETETVAAGEDTDIELNAELDEQGEPTNTLVLSGTIAEDSDTLLNVYETPDPASYARTLFIEVLQRKGVTVTADPTAVNDAADLPAADTYTADGEPIATLTSPPISEIATLIWAISHNYGADMTVCLLAVEEGSTDCEDGFAPIRSRMGDLDIAPADVWMFDGSGSIWASTTPEAMTTWVSWLHTLPWGDKLPDMLPNLGISGSLSLSQTDSPAKGKVQAKTGTWASVDPGTGVLTMLDQSLAGFMESDDGDLYVFALYMNGAGFEDASKIIGVLDRIAGVAAAMQQDL